MPSPRLFMRPLRSSLQFLKVQDDLKSHLTSLFSEISSLAIQKPSRASERYSPTSNLRRYLLASHGRHASVSGSSALCSCPWRDRYRSSAVEFSVTLPVRYFQSFTALTTREFRRYLSALPFDGIAVGGSLGKVCNSALVRGVVR